MTHDESFLQTIRDWGKKIAIAVNKADILAPPEAAEVQAFVRRAAQAVLHVEPQVMMVSARLAIRAKNGEPDRSGGRTRWRAGFMAWRVGCLYDLYGWLPDVETWNANGCSGHN